MDNGEGEAQDSSPKVHPCHGSISMLQEEVHWPNGRGAENYSVFMVKCGQHVASSLIYHP